MLEEFKDANNAWTNYREMYSYPKTTHIVLVPLIHFPLSPIFLLYLHAIKWIFFPK